MTAWDTTRAINWSARVVIAAALLAVVLVAAVPVALLAGVVLMLLGHVAGGFALFGASVLSAVAGVLLAGLSGVRHLRRLIGQRGYRVVQLRPSDYHYD